MNFIELWNKGEEFYMNQNFSVALECFEASYILNPSNTVLNYIGCCYIGLENSYKAIEVFESLIHTTHWEAPWYNLGRIHLKHENYSEALKCFDEALRINPDCDTCHFYIGVYYERTNDFKTAIEFYENAVELCLDRYDKAMYYTNMGICYTNMADNDNALICFDKAIKVCNHYKDAYICKKKLHDKQNCTEADI